MGESINFLKLHAKHQEKLMPPKKIHFWANQNRLKTNISKQVTCFLPETSICDVATTYG